MSWPYPFPISEVMRRAAEVDRRYREQRLTALGALPKPPKRPPGCVYCGAANCSEHNDLHEEARA